ncbi:flagellar filament capping protein FliD [Sulfurimonas sp.]|uniref:flagellar filament capping protein FliD n=1 Tax=Sulfurimonas sp. TaxID=2022749 RepID=UPI002616B659|nr:flagellar filament capping protein FliD [Sulfurimonas sp.]
MGISSLGVGSNVLTQDVIDQLKAADESQYVQPITNNISTEKSKAGQLNIINALMDNLTESTGNVSQYGLFDTRTATATGSAVSVTANAGSDIQDFSITVNNLATKEIEQSGSFSSATSTIASGDGEMKLSVGSKDFTFNYNAAMTLSDLKDQINKDAGNTVQASIVEVGANDFRLFLTSADTGTGHDISISDNDSGLDDQLKADTDTTDGYTNVQSATDASFKYNGLDITRKSNTVSDLLSGVTIQLKESGTSDVSVKQDVGGIEDKLDSFVSKFNSAITQLNTMTKSSQDAKERGTFSNDTTIKAMKNNIINMVGTAGDSVGGRLADYGFASNRDGTISLDHSKFEEKLKENPNNVEAFFSGGTFVESNGSTKSIDGAFDQMKNTLDRYTRYNGSLDQLKTSYSTRISSLEDQKQQATDRLTSKYNIMAKRFAAYDLMISKINSASSIFTQLANAQAASASGG